MIKKFLLEEWSHYKKLSHSSQTLLISFVLYYITDPILWTFIRAFIWRESHNASLIGIYNLFVYVGIVSGFFVNGKILKRIDIRKLYLYGLFFQGLIILFLVFLGSTNLTLLIILGLVFGFASGFFWANKSLISLFSTKNENRIYFSSIDAFLATITAVAVPFIVGWFITLGAGLKIYTEGSAYKILALITLVILFVSGIVIRKIPFTTPDVKNVFLKRTSKDWNHLRIITFVMGVLNGVEVIIPTVIALIFLGKEGALGTIQSISAIVYAISLYYIARKTDKSHRLWIFAFGIIFSLISALIFGLLYTGIGVIIFFAFYSLAGIRWTIYNPLTYDLIDKEEKRTSENHYSFIFDQELALTIGRVMGILFFLVLFLINSNFALRYTLLFLSIVQIPLIFIMKSLEKNIKEENIETGVLHETGV